jgi:hypothetical protein
MAKQETPVEAPATTEALTVQDLIVFKNIIDVTSSRGAIRPEEMPIVGNVYTKLVAFLKASGAITETPAKVEAEETPTKE